MDDFLGGLAAFYRGAGGVTVLNGQNHTVPDEAFATFLVHIWHALPSSWRPLSEGAMVSRTRQYIEHKVDWDRREGWRVKWDSRTAHWLTLKVVRPKGLTKMQTQRYSLAGRKVGEVFVVRAYFGKPRRLEPVNQYWRKRLREGSAKIIKHGPKLLNCRANTKSTQIKLNAS